MSDEDRDGRQGWRSRRAEARGRKSRVSVEDRRLGNAARAEILAKLREARDFNPEVGGEGDAGADFVSALSDEDLFALYQQHTGKTPGKKAKRPAIEAAVREAIAKQAERETSVGEDNTELDPAELALGDADRVEGDDV